MSSLNIYYQTAEGLGKRDFKTACSLSDYDIVCITWSMLSRSDSDEEVIDTNIFDIFRLDYDRSVVKNYHIWGSFIAVRKHLSAFVRRTWMTEGVECVWVTVPSQGCNGYLHVACGRFSRADNIDPFIDTLTSLSKHHLCDKFLVAGLFPPFKGGWASENLIMKRLYNSTSLAGLGQFNKVKNENDHLHNLVFSSVPVVVIRCPDPLVPEKYNWGVALQFDLDIDLLEYDKTTIDVAEENCRNIPSGLREAHEEDVNASGDVSELVETLKLHLNLIGEKFEQTVKELKGQKETSKGNVSARGVREVNACESLSERIEQRKNSKKLANIEHRLRLYADDVKRFGNMAERLKKVEDDSRKFAYLEGRLMMLEERVYPYYRNGWGWPRSTFPFNTPFGGSGSFGTAQPFGVTAGSSQRQGFGQSNTGTFGSGPHTGSTLFGQPSPSAHPNGSGFGGFSTANAGTGLCGAAPQPSTGLFGAAPQPSTGQFGQQSAALQATGMSGSSGSSGFGGFSTANAAPQPSTGLFGAAPQPSTGLFGQQSAALQTTGMSGSSGNAFGDTNNQPTPPFGATSSGTNTCSFGHTQAPGTEMLGAKPAAGGFSLPQATSSFGGTLATTSVNPAFGTSMPFQPTTFGDTSSLYGKGAGGFGTSMSSSSGLFGGSQPATSVPGSGFGTSQPQTRGLDGVMDAPAITSTFSTAPITGVPSTFSAASIFGVIKTTSASTESRISATTIYQPAARATSAFAAASSVKPTSTSKAVLVSSSASNPAAVTTSNKPATVGSEVRRDSEVRPVSPFTASTLGVGRFIKSFPAYNSTFINRKTTNRTGSIPRFFSKEGNGEIATNPDINTTTENNAGNRTQEYTTKQERVDSASSSEFTVCADIGAQDSVREPGASSVAKHTPKPGDHVGETLDRINGCKDIELKKLSDIKGSVSELISKQYEQQNLNTTELQTMIDCLQKLILNAATTSSIGNGVGVPTTTDSPYAESNNDKYANITGEVGTAIEICNKHLVADNATSGTDDGDGIAPTSDTQNRENESEFANTDEIITNVKRSNEEFIAEDSTPTIYTGEGVAASNDSTNRETDNNNSCAAKIETTTEKYNEKPNSNDALSTTNTSDTIVSMNDDTIVETENGSASTRHGNAITSEIVTVTETSNDEVTADDNASNVDTADGISTSNDKSFKDLETKM